MKRSEQSMIGTSWRLLETKRHLEEPSIPGARLRGGLYARLHETAFSQLMLRLTHFASATYDAHRIEAHPAVQSMAQVFDLLARQQAKISHLEEQVRKLQAQTMAQSSSIQESSRAQRPDAEPQQDPHQRWIDEHRDLLAQHPDCFLAFDPTRDFAIFSENEDDFDRQIRDTYQRDPTARERLLITHTSLYL